MFLVLFHGDFGGLGWVGSNTKVEGNVFCLALEPCYGFPQVFIVYLTGNVGEKNKTSLDYISDAT